MSRNCKIVLVGVASAVVLFVGDLIYQVIAQYGFAGVTGIFSVAALIACIYFFTEMTDRGYGYVHASVTERYGNRLILAHRRAMCALHGHDGRHTAVRGWCD